jgi:hypothetical protein
VTKKVVGVFVLSLFPSAYSGWRFPNYYRFFGLGNGCTVQSAEIKKLIVLRIKVLSEDLHMARVGHPKQTNDENDWKFVHFPSTPRYCPAKDEGMCSCITGKVEGCPSGASSSRTVLVPGRFYLDVCG